MAVSGATIASVTLTDASIVGAVPESVSLTGDAVQRHHRGKGFHDERDTYPYHPRGPHRGKSSPPIRLTFVDDAGVAVQPDAATLTLHLLNGTVINTRAAVDLLPSTTAAASASSSRCPPTSPSVAQRSPRSTSP